MDEELLRQADAAAKRKKLDRSKLIRRALSQYLASERIQERETQYIENLKAHPDDPKEIAAWRGIAVWPKD